MQKIILKIVILYFFIIFSFANAEENIGGMYFSYYSKNDEIVKLEFNIAERNISGITLDMQYIDKSLPGKKILKKTISCSPTDYVSRKDFPPINITCISVGLNLYLLGDTKLIRLKKRSKNGVVANLKILRYTFKNSFYDQLKKDSSHTIDKHLSFLEAKAKEEIKLQAEKEAKIKAEKIAKAKAEKITKVKAEKEAKIKAEKIAKAKAEKEAKIKAEKIAKAKAEKIAQEKAETQDRLKAEKEAKEESEKKNREKKLRELIKFKKDIKYWNQELEFYLTDIENFIKNKQNNIDNFNLIKVLAPVASIKNKTDLKKEDIIKIYDLVNFIKENSEINNYLDNKYKDKLKEKEIIISNKKEELKLILYFTYNFVNENALDKRAINLIHLHEEHSKGLNTDDLLSIDNHILSIKTGIKNNNLFNDYLKYEAKLLDEKIAIEKGKKIAIEKGKKIALEKAQKIAKAKAEKEAKAKAEKEIKLQAEKDAKAKAEKEAKVKAEKEIKLQAEKEAKIKAEKEAKAKAEKEAKAKAEKIAKVKAEKEAKIKAAKEAKLKAAKEAQLKQELIANERIVLINNNINKINAHKNILIKNINKKVNNDYINAIPLHALIEDYTIYNSENFWTYAKITSIDYSTNEVTGEKNISNLKLVSKSYTCDIYSGLKELKLLKIGMDIAFKNIDYHSVYGGYCGSYDKAVLKFNKISHKSPTDIERPSKISVDEYYSLYVRYFDLLNIEITGIISSPPVIKGPDSIMIVSHITIKGQRIPKTITCLAYGSMKSEDIYIATSKIMNTLKVGDKVTCIGSFISHDWVPDYREEMQVFHTIDIN